MTTTSNSIVKTKDVINVDVKNNQDENLGKTEEILLDKLTGQTRYVVLSFGQILGMGGKLFAVPWNAFHYDINKDCFILNIDKESLKNAPGFDKDHWPNAADQAWGSTIHEFYKTKPYWEK